MKRNLTLVLALALAFASLSPASAGEIEARAFEQFAIDIEALIGAIEGVELADVTVKKYDSGISVVSIPLSQSMVDRVRARGGSASAAKDFAAMAVGMQLSSPGDFSTLITAVDALPLTEYNVWCAVANLRDSDQEKRTTIKMKGSFTASDTVGFPAFTLNLPLVMGTTPDFGITQLSCKVVGGGKAKTKVLPN